MPDRSAAAKRNTSAAPLGAAASERFVTAMLKCNAVPIYFNFKSYKLTVLLIR